VKFADLNISNPQGAKMLYSRITLAAHAVCLSFDPDSRSLAEGRRLDACVHKAITNTVADVGQAQLSALFNATNHQPSPIMVAAAQTR
jgi:UrcA family protein